MRLPNKQDKTFVLLLGFEPRLRISKTRMLTNYIIGDHQ